jgi:anti-sigma factor RsiW
MMSRGNEHDGVGRVPASALPGHVDDWAEIAVDYLDGLLAPESKAAVQSHIQECPDCAARLRTQSSVVTFMQETFLDDAPLDLEDRVLGEVLFPSEPVATPRKEEPRGWSGTWNKKIRPWLPATIAVVALMAAITGYGVVRSSNNDLSTEGVGTSTTVAIADQVAETAARSEGNLSATTTAAAATTTAAPGSTAAPTETTATFVAAGAGEPTVLVDRKTMVAELRAAESPAYLAFMAEAPTQSDDSGSGEASTTVTGSTSETSTVETAAVSAKQAEDVASQITTLTGLEPLDAGLWLEGPTFAAYLPRDDAEQLVDLVRSIGASVGLVVGLILGQPAGTAEASARLLEHRHELCELLADRSLKPSVVNWSFTTSTLPPSEGGQDGTGWEAAAEAGTHVLVVIYVPKP